MAIDSTKPIDPPLRKTTSYTASRSLGCGSPFNVQRSLHIPNLTFDEVQSMFLWYERESGQTGDSAVVETIDETTRQKYEMVYVHPETECTVMPILIETAG